MKKLLELRKEWLNNLKKRDGEYVFLTREKNTGIWHYLNGKNEISDVVLNLKVAIDKGVGLEPEYVFDIDDPDIDGLAGAMILNVKEGTAIVEDINGIFGFGIEDVEAPAESMLYYIRTATSHIYIMLYSNGQCRMETMRALPLEYEDDISCYVPSMFD